MERRLLAFRYLLAIPLLILLGAGLLVISSGSDGSGAVARGAGPAAATESAGPGTHAPVRPVVEVDVARALEAEGVGEAMAECAGKRVGAPPAPASSAAPGGSPTTPGAGPGKPRATAAVPS
jgi:hypothetical protein